MGRIVLYVGCALLGSGCAGNRSYRPLPDNTNVVQRPVYDVDRSKTLFLGGYAGANYDFGGRPAR
jgi:hypothetical protein